MTHNQGKDIRSVFPARAPVQQTFGDLSEPSPASGHSLDTLRPFCPIFWASTGRRRTDEATSGRD